jgi:hypothetical protein
MRMRLTELASGKRLTREDDTGPKISQDLGALTDSLPPTTHAELQRAMTMLDVKCSRAATVALETAVRRAPRHLGTTESLCRVLMEAAAGESALGHASKAEELAVLASQAAQEFGDRKLTSGILSLLGNIEAGRFDLTHDAAHLNAAIAAWTRGAALDPYGTTLPLRIFNMLVSNGKTAEAGPWATKLIELDNLQRLDPLKRLTDEEMAALKKVLNTP